ncbi:MAG: 1-deoxy-D-xylulose-5-phosphate reductoisomerase [Bacilli bacterium]|nr:1-deoxy-D-xylulose-5-phosphate reductoisomerase [Bacilli bacterium]
MRKILLLGASGSIGSQALDILKRDRHSFLLTAFSVGFHIEKIEGILNDFPSVTSICVRKEEDYESLKGKYPNIKFYWGDEGLKEISEEADYDMAVNALVGFSGLVPSITILNRDKILALANKESLVVGGKLITKILAEGKGKLYPIDSEHVAIAKLLSRVDIKDVEKVLITASGGSFRDLSLKELENVTPEMALNHPTWKMGAKITIDSATMMNKGFEVIEAMVLFGLKSEQVEILMHDESHVHSLLLLKDGSYLADISVPDMHGPIEYALYEGKVDFNLVKANKLKDLGPYHFHKFDPNRYKAPIIAIKAYEAGGDESAVLNAANEEAVYAFLRGDIPFLSIEKEVEKALSKIAFDHEHISLRKILQLDQLTRIYCRKRFERR